VNLLVFGLQLAMTSKDPNEPSITEALKVRSMEKDMKCHSLFRLTLGSLKNSSDRQDRRSEECPANTLR
jgi:hypothetical protein